MGNNTSKKLTDITYDDFFTKYGNSIFVKLIDSDGIDPMLSDSDSTQPIKTGPNYDPTGSVIYSLGMLGHMLVCPDPNKSDSKKHKIRTRQSHIAIITPDMSATIKISKAARVVFLDRFHVDVIIPLMDAAKDPRLAGWAEASMNPSKLSEHLDADELLSPKGQEFLYDLMWRNGTNIRYVPEQARTAKVCKYAAKDSGFALPYVPDTYAADLYELAIKSAPLSFTHIPPDRLTEDMCIRIVEHNPLLLFSLPESKRTQRVTKAAVTKDGVILGMLRPDQVNLAIAAAGVQDRANAIRWVPPQFVDTITELHEIQYKE